MDPSAGRDTFRHEFKKREEQTPVPKVETGAKARARKLNLKAMRSYPSVVLAGVAIVAVLLAFGYQIAKSVG